MSKCIGIDLGTTNSCVYVMEGGKPTVIPNREGGRIIPSVISFSKSGDGSRTVGMPAKRTAVTNPKNTVYSVKRLIGRHFDDVQDLIKKLPYKVVKTNKGTCAIQINDRDYSPEELSAMILQEAKLSAEKYLNAKVTRAVITVPAYFNDEQRQATKKAGEIAGLKVERIINEPTAAALAYSLEKNQNKNLKVIVYDLGGGTFDVSILECGEGVFEVKGTSGDMNLGGDDFDERIISWLVDDFKKQEGIDLHKDATAMQRVKEAAEKAKKELSAALKTEINLPYISASAEGPKHLIVELSRSKFEQLCDDLFEKTRIPSEKALKASGFSKEEIDEVVLIGGSTRIPKIQEIVKELFGKETKKDINPDEAVAHGAAIQGAILSGEKTGVLLLDVTPISLGIETLGGVFTKLIESNTTIPTSKSETFSTAEDNQETVDIKVYQGERPIARDNKLLGQFYLGGIRKALRGEPKIEVTFDIDANGILNVSAKDQATSKKQEIRIENSSLEETEVKRMKEEAKKYEAQDKKKREEIDTLNKADTVIFQLEKDLKKHEDKLSEDLKEKVRKLVDKLKDAHSKKDVTAIKDLLKEQETLWKELIAQIAAQKTAQSNEKKEEAAPKASNENVTEAEFEEVKE